MIVLFGAISFEFKQTVRSQGKFVNVLLRFVPYLGPETVRVLNLRCVCMSFHLLFKQTTFVSMHIFFVQNRYIYIYKVSCGHGKVAPGIYLYT